MAPSRRLRRVAGHLATQPAAQAEPLPVQDFRVTTDDGAAGMTPLPIQPDGQLSPATLAQLTEQRDAAAAAHDYRTAAGLQDLITVLTPRDLTLDDFSPPTLEGQTNCYMEHGFCVFPAAVQGAELQALQEAWLAAEAPAREGWQKRVAAAELKAAEEQEEQDRKELAQFNTRDDSFPEQTFGLGFDYTEPAFTALLEHPTFRPFFEAICSTGERYRLRTIFLAGLRCLTVGAVQGTIRGRYRRGAGCGSCRHRGSCSRRTRPEHPATSAGTA